MTSASSPSSSATSLSTPSASNPSRTALALGVSLGILALFAIGGILYWTYRRRRYTNPDDAWFPLSAHATQVEPRHLASRITPFGTRDAHEPGKNMRIANRRSNGVWEFTNPEGDFSPSGIGDADVKTPPRKDRKEKEAKSFKLPSRGYLDAEAIAYPPPAYNAHHT